MASSELSFASPQNPQENSVFFTLFPKEVRDEIFDLAITPYEKREDFLPEDLQYNRPGFRNSYRRISTALLRTCQRIYAETCDIPAHNYIKIDWYFNNSSKHGHGGNDANFQKLIFPSKMQSLHVYTTSEDLELCVFWGKYIDQIATQAPDLRHLKMTLGNFDTETESVPSLLPDPNFPESEPNMYNIVNWGWHLQRLKNLMILEIEAETTINWMQDLDEAVARVKQWRIAVTSDKTLVLNPQKIGRDGWHGPVRSKILDPINLVGTDALNSRATIYLLRLAQQQPQRLQCPVLPGISSTT